MRKFIIKTYFDYAKKDDTANQILEKATNQNKTSIQKIKDSLREMRLQIYINIKKFLKESFSEQMVDKNYTREINR